MQTPELAQFAPALFVTREVPGKEDDDLFSISELSAHPIVKAPAVKIILSFDKLRHLQITVEIHHLLASPLENPIVGLDKLEIEHFFFGFPSPLGEHPMLSEQAPRKFRCLLVQVLEGF